MARRTVVVCSIGAGPHAELLEMARPGIERWANTHGYDTDLRFELPCPERPASWSKVRVLAERLQTHDVALWIDADCVVVDSRQDMAALVDRRRPVGVVAHRYAGQVVPNLGVMALRSCRMTRKLLDQLWAMTEYTEHKWWENAAFLDLLGYDIVTEPIRKVRRSSLERRVRYLDVAWNSIDLDSSPAPIINHYPGLDLETRRVRMRAAIESPTTV